MPEIEPNIPKITASEMADLEQIEQIDIIYESIQNNPNIAAKVINFYTYNPEQVEKVYEFLGDDVERFKLLGKFVTSELKGATKYVEFDEETEKLIASDQSHKELLKAGKGTDIGVKKVRINRLAKFASLIKKFSSLEATDGNAA